MDPVTTAVDGRWQISECGLLSKVLLDDFFNGNPDSLAEKERLHYQLSFQNILTPEFPNLLSMITETIIMTKKQLSEERIQVERVPIYHWRKPKQEPEGRT